MKSTERFLFFILLFSGSIVGVKAQKLVIDTTSIGKWPRLESPQLSPDGIWASYVVKDPVKGDELFLQNIRTGAKTSFFGGFDAHFSADGKKFIFNLKSELHIHYLDGVRADSVISYRRLNTPYYKRDQWLSFENKDESGQITVLNLVNGQQHFFNQVKDYRWDDQGTAIVMVTAKESQEQLVWVDVPSMRISTITTDAPGQLALNNCVFNFLTGQLAYVRQETVGGKTAATLYRYDKNSNQTRQLLSDQSQGIPQDLTLGSLRAFSKTGHWLFFMLQPKPVKRSAVDPAKAQVDIYSYKSPALPGQQPKTPDNGRYIAAISTSGGEVKLIEHPVNGREQMMTFPERVAGDHIILRTQLDKDFKPKWLGSRAFGEYSILSLKTGVSKLFKREEGHRCSGFQLSPDDRYVLYWDSRQATYLRYEITTGKTVNIMSRIPGKTALPYYYNLFDQSLDAQAASELNWLDDGRSFLFCADYDIWKVDVDGVRRAVNVTNGFGERNHIRLRLLDGATSYPSNGTFIVSGLNMANMDNGFYQLTLKDNGGLRELTMGPYCYYLEPHRPVDGMFGAELGILPVKAAAADAWILGRTSGKDYPNYYYTRDWKTFKPLTNLQPQNTYNWLTSELIRFRQLDGSWEKGILYKPTNFDPKKKYPVLLNYYEQVTYRLHGFPVPNLTEADLNIPWFVSRGYLVFTPDITFVNTTKRAGATPGEKAANSVIGAVNYLTTLPYVESKRIGLQGHSFGGGITNYLVTHFNRFAAAASAGGTVSDQFSAYLGPYRQKGTSPREYRMFNSENAHDMLGATPWQRPDLYLRASSVFRANRVTTPLLLMHNEKDEQTDWGQSFELFNALRRLGKPSWLLQYDNSGHILENFQDRYDYTIRLTQFYDHYLKNTPAPKWMTDGIPASMKGIDTGFELMPGKTP